jgi:hypothetical protein
MTADDRPVEKEYWDIEVVATLENGVPVHVHQFDRRQLHSPPERAQLRNHLLTEMAVAPMDYRENDPPFSAAASARRALPVGAAR